MGMALTVIDQMALHLPGGGHEAACGVASIISVLTSLTGVTAYYPDQIFQQVATTRSCRGLGATPGGIADYLVAQRRGVGGEVWYSISGMVHTPITLAVVGGLTGCTATRLTNPPQYGAPSVGGPPYFIHFLKVRGLSPMGHYVVSDGLNNYMDPGNRAQHLRAGLPDWLDFYDTNLLVVVE
jgi:hypothetical protein